MTKLQAINREFLRIAPNGLPSDIVPWLGLLYRNRERKVELLFKEFLEIVDTLYKRAAKSYVPGTVFFFLCVSHFCFKAYMLVH